MPRRSLKPELNKIRAWVRQGRTDAWIAHQLEVTVQQIETFKRDQHLDEDGESNGSSPDFDDELDLRAEDDAMVAAELDAAAAESAERDDDEEDDGDDKPRRRRSRRGGRGRRRRSDRKSVV